MVDVVNQVVDDVAGDTKLRVQIQVQFLARVLTIPATGRNLVSFQEVRAVGTAVVGGEEEQIVAAAHLLVEHTEEMGEILVQLHVDIVVFLAACAVSMAYGIGGGDAYAEHVGDVVPAQLLVQESGLGHFEGHRDTFIGGLDILSGCIVVGGIELLYPVGQLFHVISAGDEVAHGVVEPVGGIGRVAGGQDGGTVLERDTDDFRLEVGGQLQLVADGGGV